MDDKEISDFFSSLTIKKIEKMDIKMINKIYNSINIIISKEEFYIPGSFVIARLLDRLPPLSFFPLKRIVEKFFDNEGKKATVILGFIKIDLIDDEDIPMIFNVFKDLPLFEKISEISQYKIQKLKKMKKEIEEGSGDGSFEVDYKYVYEEQKKMYTNLLNNLRARKIPIDKILSSIDGNSVDNILDAACAGDLRSIGKIIEKNPEEVKREDHDDNTPLILAASRGHYNVVDFLVVKGSDINHKNSSGQTAIHLAARFDNAKIIELLADRYNANIEIETNKLERPIHYAARYGNVNSLQKLLELKSDPNCQDEEGQTPTFMAARYGHSACIEELIKFGADINLPTNFKETPLNIAARFGHIFAIHTLFNNNKGARPKVNFYDRRKNTPLMYAAIHGHTEVVNVLLEHGADPEIVNNGKKSALQLCNNKEIKDILQRAIDDRKKPATDETE